MRIGAGILVVAALAASNGAVGQIPSSVTPGAWSAYGPIAPTSSCGVQAQANGGNLWLTAGTDYPGAVRLALQNPAWTFAPNAPVTIATGFDSGHRYTWTGKAREHSMSLALEPAELKPWMHDFTAGRQMTVEFQHDPPWTFDLTGTTPAITTMAKCIADAGLLGLPPPFAPSATTQSAGTSGQSAPLQFSPAPPQYTSTTGLSVAPAWAPGSLLVPNKDTDVCPWARGALAGNSDETLYRNSHCLPLLGPETNRSVIGTPTKSRVEFKYVQDYSNGLIIVLVLPTSEGTAFAGRETELAGVGFARKRDFDLAQSNSSQPPTPLAPPSLAWTPTAPVNSDSNPRADRARTVVAGDEAIGCPTMDGLRELFLQDWPVAEIARIVDRQHCVFSPSGAELKVVRDLGFVIEVQDEGERTGKSTMFVRSVDVKRQ